MTRNVFIFLATFVAGALIALVVRAAIFNPHADHEGHPAGGGDYRAMVGNPIAPARAELPAAPATTPAPLPAAPVNTTVADPHATHGTLAAADDDKPVNTVCAICGMDVDPKAGTAKYQGKTIGFGCRMCPSKFKSDPDRYGPYYLRNEVIDQ